MKKHNNNNNNNIKLKPKGLTLSKNKKFKAKGLTLSKNKKFKTKGSTLSKDTSNVVIPILKYQNRNQNVGTDNKKEETSNTKKLKYENGKTTENTKFKGENPQFRKNIGENSNNNYEENEIMTNFDGYWILRKNLEHMKKLSDDTKNQIIADRKDGDKSLKLTPEEEQIYKKKMKPSKKFQTKMLKKAVIMTNKCSLGIKWKKPGKYLNIEYKNNEHLVKFGGYFIKKAAAEQIQKLCDSMRAKGCPEDEVASVRKFKIRKEERKMKQELKRKSSTTQYETAPLQHALISKNSSTSCFKCNSLDHLARNCPLNKINTDPDNESNIEKCFKSSEVDNFSKNCPSISQINDKSNIEKCYKCNEVGHFPKSCPKTSKASEESNIIKCYKCNGVGHFSKSCPKSNISNEGSNIVKCYKCNEVGHFSKSCPKTSKASEESNIIKCYKCNEVGHFSKSCPKSNISNDGSSIVKSYISAEVGLFSKSFPKNSKTNEKSNIVRCYKCNEVGHFSKSCSNYSK